MERFQIFEKLNKNAATTICKDLNVIDVSFSYNTYTFPIKK